MPESHAKTQPMPELNRFFEHRLRDGRVLLITELGRIACLSGQEYSGFKQGKLDSELSKKLEEAAILMTPKGRERAVNDLRLRYMHVSGSVSLHIVNPTMRCNQNCLYCYANAFPLNSKGHDMDEETASKALDFIWQCPNKNIVIEFQGGEPLANFPIIEFMVEQAKKRKGKKVHWRLVSNFSLLDEEKAAFFQKNKIFDLCTSLDGPKEVHDKNRPLAKKSSFEQTVHWIKALKKDYGFRHLGALCTVTKNSLPFAKEIVDTYLELGFPDITPVPIRKIGLAEKNWAKIGYSWQEYFAFWKELADYCISLSKKGREISDQISVLMLSKIDRVKPSYHTCYSKPCGSALVQCSYQPNGDIYACDEAKAEPIFKIGDIFQGYKAVFTSPQALNMVSLSSSLNFLCNQCKFKGFCSICPVLTYCSQKNPVPKLALDESCRLKKAQFSFLLEKLFGEDRPVLKKWLKGRQL